jgi:hypothetical protein
MIVENEKTQICKGLITESKRLTETHVLERIPAEERERVTNLLVEIGAGWNRDFGLSVAECARALHELIGVSV